MTHLAELPTVYLATLFWQICKSHTMEKTLVCKRGPELEHEREGHLGGPVG